jgi:hypothetical protein
MPEQPASRRRKTTMKGFAMFDLEDTVETQR